jgi:glycosyltransferase involved in cell wall biosynthesis
MRRARSCAAVKTVRILGTHGLPAAYGGFETAVQYLARFLASEGWRVIVYCQEDGVGATREDVWNGVERVIIPIDVPGWRGTSKFDYISIRHASRFNDLCLTFGYNTAILNMRQRFKRIPNLINMDGIEWSRSRWGPCRQAILYVNERIAYVAGNHLIADHPEIENHLARRTRRPEITTIAYGADPVTNAPTIAPLALGLEPGRYMTLICRTIPENSILELVRGFSDKPRGVKLAVLGTYSPGEDPYHRLVMESASDEVVFLGSIFHKADVEALRFHSVAYLHGHTVGGTNPSLVEAMAAGNPIIAHDNPYNRWVAKDAAVYFSTAEQASECIDDILASPSRLEQMSAASRRRHASEFTADTISGKYEQLLLRYLPTLVGTSLVAEAVTEPS